MRHPANLPKRSPLPVRTEVAVEALAILGRMIFGQQPVAIRLPVTTGRKD